MTRKDVTTVSTAPHTGARIRRRLARAAAAAVAATLVLAGCSIQIRSEPDPTIPDDTMLLAADKGTPMMERNFNPYLVNKRVAATYMYEPLMVVNVIDGTFTPWLAEEVSQPDPLTIDYTIRDGVTWSDGEEFTPEDVAFTFELIKEYPTLDLKGAWQRIESIEVDGDHVIFTLTEPDSPALDVLSQTMIVPEHIWADVEAPDTWRNPEPVGTGPYTLGNFSAQQYTMDKNQDYWQAENVNVEHLVLPASTTELDIVTQGFDWAYAFLSNVEGTWQAANENNQYWFPPGGVQGLIPNFEVAPFDDPDVRRGIALALDRQAIADAATEGTMTPGAQTGLMLPNQEAYLNPDIPNQGIIEQNTDAALEAFAAAGFTQQGDTMVGPDGQPFTIEITTANGYADWLRAAQQIQRQLGSLGIEVNLVQPQPPGYQQAIQNGDFQMAIGGMGGGLVYQTYESLLSSEFYAPVGEQTSNNFQRYQNPEADALLAEYRATVDEDEQLEIIHRLQELVYEDMPVIGLWHGGLWGLYSDARFTGWPSADDPYAPPQTYDSSPLLVFTRLELAGSED